MKAMLKMTGSSLELGFKFKTNTTQIVSVKFLWVELSRPLITLSHWPWAGTKRVSWLVRSFWPVRSFWLVYNWPIGSECAQWRTRRVCVYIMQVLGAWTRSGGTYSSDKARRKGWATFLSRFCSSRNKWSRDLTLASRLVSNFSVMVFFGSIGSVVVMVVSSVASGKRRGHSRWRMHCETLTQTVRTCIEPSKTEVYVWFHTKLVVVARWCYRQLM